MYYDKSVALLENEFAANMTRTVPNHARLLKRGQQLPLPGRRLTLRFPPVSRAARVKPKKTRPCLLFLHASAYVTLVKSLIELAWPCESGIRNVGYVKQVCLHIDLHA